MSPVGASGNTLESEGVQECGKTMKEDFFEKRTVTFCLMFALFRGNPAETLTPTTTGCVCFLLFRRGSKALSALFRLQVAAGEHRRLLYDGLMLAGVVWSLVIELVLAGHGGGGLRLQACFMPMWLCATIL